MSRREEGTLDVAALLSIDVEAEVRKLSRAQLEGPAQLPVELVRRALGAGATSVELSIGRGGIAVRDDGAPVGHATVDSLRVLLDDTAAASARHSAILSLEAGGHLALIALAGLDAKAIRLRSGDRTLRVRRGSPPSVEASGVERHGTTVELADPGLDPDAVRDALGHACRFAEARIVVDGRASPRPAFGDVLRSEPLHEPLPGRLALPATGDTARVWILLDGVVAAHAAMPGVPCFEAAVESRAIFPRGRPLPPAAALREALEPHLPVLADRALDLLARAAHDCARSPAAHLARLRELVLAAARRNQRAAAMCSAPVFRAVRAFGAEEARLSIDDLQDLAAGAGGGRTLVALFPEQEPSRFLLPAGDVPVLDATERGRLAAMLSISFRPPQARRAEGGRLARLRAALAAVRRGLRDLGGRVAHPLGHRTIPEGSLAPDERALLGVLRAHVMTEACEDLEIRIVRGSGPVRRLERPRPSLCLPRENPVVRSAVRALARDRTWIYPVVLALEATPRPATRSLFRERG